ncbi:MAG: MFS transporter [Gammaproteobacteria bacterium]|nr:MFS transporter [Gammaproteobacteria bacterium]
MQVRNLMVLVGCQLITATSTISLVTLGGIIGTSLTSNKALVTLPLSLMVVAVASSAIPATLLMRRFGRRGGFMLASSVASIGMFVGVIALQQSSFVLFCVATMMLGVNMAFTQQYRYAAAESVAPEFVARAISFVLLGSIGGAFLGKELVTRGAVLIEGIPYAGIMAALALLFILQILLLSMLQEPAAHHQHDEPHSDRPLGDIIRQPVFLAAVAGGVVAYGIMTLIMTATPLSMHLTDGYTIEETSSVIRAHVLAMYLPSLVAGFLIDRVGVTWLMIVGALGLLATSLIGLQGHTFLHYWWALVLLGIGWNFLYVGGTTLLTYTYSMAERFRAQAVNEFLVFGVSAAASLLAGTVMFYFGWTTLMLVPIPILIAITMALVVVRRDPLLQRRIARVEGDRYD